MIRHEVLTTGNIHIPHATALLTCIFRWSYVQEHRVQLPDEYDQINKDLEPFWGVNPKDLQNIQRDWEGHADTYTIGKDDMEDTITLLNYTLPGNDRIRYDLAGGAFQVMELLEDVEKFIPPFRAVFSPHDNPNLLTDWELKQMALQAARRGECELHVVGLIVSWLIGII